MRWLLLIVGLTAADAIASSAAADCTCRSQGRDYELGRSVCLQSPKGARIATCGMVLNNTSWQFSETPCVISLRIPAQRVTAVRGGQVTLASRLRDAP